MSSIGFPLAVRREHGSTNAVSRQLWLSPESTGSGSFKFEKPLSARGEQNPGRGGGTTAVRAIRAGRGQVGPCLTDEAHRPLPERHSHLGRYAGARILQQRSLRRIFAGGVMSSPLLRTNASVGPQLKLCRAARSVKVRKSASSDHITARSSPDSVGWAKAAEAQSRGTAYIPPCPPRR